jgi:hypothetical protein
MPRPRKNDSITVVGPLVEEFARRLGETLERFISGRVTREAAEALRDRTGRAGKASRRKRARVTCYYPGCTNVAAPRFGMFCAALHKDLPRADKEKFRAAHDKKRVQA